MIYPIVIYGSPVLRNKSVEITPDYPELKKLIDDMFLTLTEAEGVGLAAPQIGKNIRLFIVDCTPWAEDDPSLADYNARSSMPRSTSVRSKRTFSTRGVCRCPGFTRMCDVPCRSACVTWTKTSSSTTRSSAVCQRA